MTGVLIAGTASGVGKTTVTLALLAAMRRRGLIVQAFKGGPDFLDTGHHTRISGRPARNIDTWMLNFEANKDVLRQAAQGADAVLAEGMMGLFDGKDGATESGSSAEIAKLLELPVILVVDAGKSARSIAAVVLGFELFDVQLPLAGIILNRVASERHFRMLETAILSACKTPILGWLPRDPSIEIPERHLGLHTAEELDNYEDRDGITERQIEALGLLAEKHLDVDRILSFECGLDLQSRPVFNQTESAGRVRIGVARDRAFSFYYEDNFDLLRQHGAVIVPFSPLHDLSVPENIDALYLGGGYPELYAEQLSANAAMRASIQAFAASGRPVYAECGGMIYLSRQLTLTNGITYSMAGVFPFVIEMADKLQQFGYVTVELTDDCLLGMRGTTIRGHSFHYSRMVNISRTDTHYRVQYSLSGKQENEGYGVGNVLASYIHLHFRAAPAAALHFVAVARKMQSAHTVSTGT
jgi:cobyrinic acid a,c-diamide synthase